MSEQKLWLEKSLVQLDSIGLYSTDRKSVIKVSVSIVVLAIYSVMCLLDMKYNCIELTEYTESLALFLPSAASLTFLVCFILNRDKMQLIMHILRHDFKFNKFSLEAEVLHLKLVKYSQYYVYFTFLVFVSLAIQSYMERHPGNVHDAKANGLPARAWSPYDLTFLPYFILFYVFEEVAVGVVLHVTIPIAMFFASLLIHLRAQLYYLQHCLKQVCEQEDANVSRMMLKKCLKLHHLLIDFTENMQEGFNSILLIHSYSPSIVISVAGYQASMMSVLDPQFFPFFCQVNYILAECFVYCYFGQHIIDESTLLGFIAYDNKWYNTASDIGKDLSLIVMRCQHPLRLVFLGSIDSSLETYYNIVKTGYSYFVFLANMNEDEE